MASVAGSLSLLPCTPSCSSSSVLHRVNRFVFLVSFFFYCDILPINRPRTLESNNLSSAIVILRLFITETTTEKKK